MEIKYPGQRDELDEELGYDLHQKALPTLFVAALIWMTSTLFYSGTLNGKPLQLGIGSLITLIVGYFAISIATVVFAAKRQNDISRLLFMALAFISGMVSSLTVEWGVYIVGVELARNLFVGSTIVAVFAIGAAMIIGLKVKDQIKGNFMFGFMIFGFSMIIQEIILIWIFGFSTALFFITIIELIWIFGITIYDCATLHEKIKAGYWMMAIIDIFLDLVIITIRIFILLIYMFADN